MRSFIFALIVLAVMLSVIAVVSKYSDTTVGDLLSRFDGINQSIDAGDWTKAYSEGCEAGIKFEEYSRIYGLYLDHEHIDNITTGIIRLKCHILAENKSLSKAELETVMFFVDEARHKDIPSLYNIF